MLKGIDLGKLNIDIQLGKNKINDNFIEHINKMFNNKEIVKIKMLQNYLVDEGLVGNKDKKKEIIKNIEKSTGSNCVFFVGNTFCLYKKKIIKKKIISEKYKPKQTIFNKYSKRKEQKDQLNPRRPIKDNKPKVKYENRKNR